MMQCSGRIKGSRMSNMSLIASHLSLNLASYSTNPNRVNYLNQSRLRWSILPHVIEVTIAVAVLRVGPKVGAITKKAAITKRESTVTVPTRAPTLVAIAVIAKEVTAGIKEINMREAVVVVEKVGEINIHLSEAPESKA